MGIPSGIPSQESTKKQVQIDLEVLSTDGSDFKWKRLGYDGPMAWNTNLKKNDVAISC